LLEKVEQVVRLIRSKGVGVYFVTQNPLDIPETVLGQLGNRVQHALRAYTPRDQRAVRTAASTMRQNPAIDTEQAITELGVGEALVSMLDDKGRPSVVERAWICPPASRIGPITDDERAALLRRSIVAGIYDKTVDRESAFERLRARAEGEAAEAAAKPSSAPAGTARGGGTAGGGLLDDLLGGGGRRQSTVEAMAKSAARSIGSTLGRQIVRGILGTLTGGKRR
jgi:DNA helicase HerA-like ATPase